MDCRPPGIGTEHLGTLERFPRVGRREEKIYLVDSGATVVQELLRVEHRP